METGMSERPPVYYFDNNATTRVAPEVIEAMLPFLKDDWGNPSSAYTFGQEVRRHLDAARAAVAELIHAETREIIFTSCGTESINAALNNARLTRPGRRHSNSSADEHSATPRFSAYLGKLAYE